MSVRVVRAPVRSSPGRSGAGRCSFCQADTNEVLVVRAELAGPEVRFCDECASSCDEQWQSLIEVVEHGPSDDYSNIPPD